MRFRTRREAVAWAAVLPLAWVIWCSIPSSSPFVNGWPWTPFGGRASYWQTIGEPGYIRDLRTGDIMFRLPETRDRVVYDTWSDKEVEETGRWVENDRTGERVFLRGGERPPDTSVTESWLMALNRNELRSARVTRLMVFFTGLVVASVVGCWLVVFLPGRPRRSRRSRREAIERPVIRI